MFTDVCYGTCWNMLEPPKLPKLPVAELWGNKSQARRGFAGLIQLWWFKMVEMMVYESFYDGFMRCFFRTETVFSPWPLAFLSHVAHFCRSRKRGATKTSLFRQLSGFSIRETCGSRRTSCVVDIHVMGCLGLSIFVSFLGFNKILMNFLSNNHVKQP